MIKSLLVTKTNQLPEEQASVPSKTSAKLDLFYGNVTSMFESSFNKKNRTNAASKVLICHNLHDLILIQVPEENKAYS